MNKNINLLLLLCMAFFLFNIKGISQDIIKERIIIKSQKIDNYYYELASSISEGNGFTIDMISRDLNLYLINFEKPIDDRTFNQLKNSKVTEYISYDYTLEERNRPNDPRLAEQWYIDFLQLPKVWEYTIGGKTKNGKDIVIAILDTGIQVDHSDLKENIYVNSLEIPLNGLDDDGNGFKDDISGINIQSGNGVHSSGFHGTWVTGVAGARGNNNMGVTGVNWNVKILPLTGVTNVANLLKGYDYILNMRKLYNQTNGAKGALIVTANYSGGLAEKFGTDPAFRPWCEMYDLLGAQGIVSVGSVVNSNVDIDIVGDLPTTCESEFLITVTNNDQMGALASGSGYGKKFVDIAAPGENIFGLANNNSYKADEGTSASAPVIAGLIGLLYSADCSNLDEQIKTNPRALALEMKKIIMKSAVKTASLETKTVSGGHINAFDAYVNLQDICSNQIIKPAIKGDLKINFVSQVANNIVVNYITPDEKEIEYYLHNPLGQVLTSGKITPPQFGDKVFSIDIANFPPTTLFLSILRNKEKVNWNFIPFRK